MKWSAGLGLLLAATACGGSSATPLAAPKPSPTPVRAASTYTIAMRGLAFSPATLTLAVGDSVRVRNADSAHHTFTDAPVVCRYHASAGMTGSITVR